MSSLFQVLRRWCFSTPPRTSEQVDPLSFREKRRQYLLDPTRPPQIPIPFGYKMGWLTLRTSDILAVVQSLHLRDPHEISWGAGMLAQEEQWETIRGDTRGKQAEPDCSCFVTPCVRGWIFVIGPFRWGISWRGGERESLITKLSKQFGEAQSFLTDRIPEVHHWMRATDGVLLRSMVCDWEKGIIWSDYGSLTPVEQRLQWARVYQQQWFPGEEEVMTVATEWSLNPTMLDTISPQEITGTGVLARLSLASLRPRYSLLVPHPPTAIVDPTSTVEWP